MIRLAVASSLAAALLLGGCAGQSTTSAGQSDPTTAASATSSAPTTSPSEPDWGDLPDTSAETPAAAETPVAVETLEELGPDPAMFPRGYPKVVLVKTLPYQVRSWYEGDYKRAVAMAPGVWTPLAPGASVLDAVESGTADGFCGSIKAYERKYLDGEEFGGACW